MFELSDGRSLSVSESGDPHGMPVLFCHGTPGSRRTGPADRSLAAQLGVRLITVDRPGYGGSTRQRGRAIHNWSSDVDELIEALGIETFGLAAWSGGAAFALAAAEVHAERVRGVAIVAPFGPFDADDAPDFLPPRRARQVRLLRSRQIGIRAAAALSAFALRDAVRTGTADPATAVTTAREAGPDADRAILDRPDVAEQLATDRAEALAQGAAGWADDLAALAKPWAVDLRAVRAPVTVWHGSADADIAPGAAHELVESIPRAALHLLPGAGHLVIHDLWPEVLRMAIGA